MDDLFVIDTAGKALHSDDEDDDDSDEGGREHAKALLRMVNEMHTPESPPVSKLSSVNNLTDYLRKGSYLDMQLDTEGPVEINKTARTLTAVDEIMKKSVITPGFEKLESLPPYEVSKRKLQKERRKEREKTKGPEWFNMRAAEMTDEKKHDLEILQMRSVLDPKHFYKKNDLKVLPKFFHVGKIIESPADFYHSRIPKKMRKKTIVDELLADAEFQKYNKKKYKEIIEQKKKTHYKAHRQAKKLKKKKKK